MRRPPLALAVLAAVLTAPAAHAADGPGPLVPREVTSLRSAGHALLRLERRDAAAEDRLRAAGGTLVSRRLSIWRLPGRDAARLVPPLAVAGLLSDAEPEVRRGRTDHHVAGDPLLPSQWWLERIGAPADVEPPGPGRRITIIDSGIDTSHPEFAGRAETAVLNEQRIVGRDDFHATAVASVIAAPANGIGLVGLYPRALLASWDASPAGELTNTAVIRGIVTAAALGPGVINLSVGGAERSRLEADAVDDAVARGSVLVAAAGNERETDNAPQYPASLPHVLTVGASDQNDGVASFSNTSPGMDLVAPGVSIPAAVPVRGGSSGYTTVEGTSFSAPIVAAAAAWVWTARPELDGTQVFELVRRSARDLGGQGRDRDSGFGLVNLPAALAAPAPARDPQEPNETVDHVRPNGLLRSGRLPLTTPPRRTGQVAARLDAADDPRDVYRVWSPARSTVTIRAAGPVRVQLAAPHPGIRLVRVGATYQIRNTSRRGAYVYPAVTLSGGGPTAIGAYRLTLTTASARR